MGHGNDKVIQLDRRDGAEVIVTTASEILATVEHCIREMITRKELCDASCKTGGVYTCGPDTRISLSRMANLTRRRTDNYIFTGNLPLTPGQTKTWEVPPYPIGRVIENFFFRPQMADGGNVDDIKVDLAGDDGVLWASFTGGRHNLNNGCCLLDLFSNDCIGYQEGFRITLTHLGPNGSPNMVRAVADWNYIFPGQSSSVYPNWRWPSDCRKVG